MTINQSDNNTIHRMLLVNQMLKGNNHDTMHKMIYSLFVNLGLDFSSKAFAFFDSAFLLYQMIAVK